MRNANGPEGEQMSCFGLTRDCGYVKQACSQPLWSVEDADADSGLSSSNCLLDYTNTNIFNGKEALGQ